MGLAQDEELAQTLGTEGAETIWDTLVESNGIANTEEVEKKQSTQSTDSEVSEVTEASFLFQLCPNSSKSNYVISCIPIILCIVAFRNYPLMKQVNKWWQMRTKI